MNATGTKILRKTHAHAKLLDAFHNFVMRKTMNALRLLAVAKMLRK